MKELNWAPFLLLVCTLGNPSRAPEQGFLWYSGGFSAPCPNFTAYSLSLCALSPSLSFSVCMYSYALIPHPLCCPWPRMLTDANWGCRAQLGPIEAVYLIKTCEDPTGASAREDTASIYRFEHRRAHTSISRESKEDKKPGASLWHWRPCLPFHQYGKVQAKLLM